MYFYYYRYKENFGYALNQRIWPRLIKTELTENLDEDEVFVGIGTLLNESLPNRKVLHVFGSGAGYGEVSSLNKQRLKIHFVRGPLTAKKLGVSNALAITDPAILLSRSENIDLPKEYKCSFFPHHEIDSPRYKLLCESIGLNYISPTSNCDLIISEIIKSERLICSAMHGAIVAEALRVPWLPVITDDGILTSKWDDWAASMDFSVNFEKLPTIWPVTKAGIVGSAVGALKVIAVKDRLRSLSRSTKFFLGKDSILADRLIRIEEKIDSFNNSGC